LSGGKLETEVVFDRRPEVISAASRQPVKPFQNSSGRITEVKRVSNPGENLASPRPPVPAKVVWANASDGCPDEGVRRPIAFHRNK
jgi:hypothetical protein